jgi:hypothetical protein
VSSSSAFVLQRLLLLLRPLAVLVLLVGVLVGVLVLVLPMLPMLPMLLMLLMPHWLLYSQAVCMSQAADAEWDCS